MKKNLAVGFIVPVILLSICCWTGVAAAGAVTEDFTSTQFKDAALTTAWWDTAGEGELKLYPFVPGVIGNGAMSGECYAVQTAGRHAFVAAGSAGLWVLDISNPAVPIRVGHYDTPGIAYDVCVAGDRAAVADGSGGVELLDITDPTNPTLMGSYTSIGEARGVCLGGDKIYAAFGVRGLVVLVYTPVGLVQYGVIGTPGEAMDVQVDGDYAFVADGSQGLQVIDISDPAHPVSLSSLDTPGQAKGVMQAGDQVFIADAGSGLQIIDIAAPSSPVLAGTYATPGEARSVWVDGDRAYVADSAEGLLVLDIGDPSAPALAASVVCPGTASGVMVSGELAFVAAFEGGLQVFEVRTSVGPSWVKRVSTGGDGRGIAIAGNYAYVAAYVWGGLQVVDISDPASAAVVGFFNTVGSALDVAVAGDYAYVAGETSGLQVIDVSDPTNPTQVGAFNTPGSALGVCVAGDVAFVADDQSGLQVIDVSDPTAPAFLTSFDTPGRAYGVCVDGLHVFLADYTGGLRVFDVSIPSSPISLGVANTPGDAYGVFATGDLVYVADGPAGLQIFDVSNPAAPHLLGGVDTPSRAVRVEVSGQIAFVADFQEGVQMIDVGDPAAPVAVGELDNFDYGHDVAVAGDFLFIAGSNFGLEIAQVFQEELDTGADHGGSLPLSPSGGDAHLVSKVRLTTDQVGDVTWQVRTTAQVGSVWQDIVPDGAWNDVAPGWDLRWLSTHTWSYGFNPTCRQINLEWLTPAAGLAEIGDIPDDQGGWLRVQILRSTFDFLDEETPITSYGIWRRVDDPVFGAVVSGLQPDPVAMEGGGLPAVTWQDRTFVCSPLGVEPSPFFPPGIWEWVGYVPSLQIDTYLAAVPTQRDWMPTDTRPTALVVTAHTAVPSVWFVSLPDSASSRDNIAPGVPLNIAADYQAAGVVLDWEDAPEEDFQYYRVYRGSTPDFSPTPENLIHETAVSGWTDPLAAPWDNYYLITALDHVGNESEPGSPETISTVGNGAPPARYALLGAVPNPFNPSTKLVFEMAAAGHARLKVYDGAGRLVATLVDEPRSAGRHEVIWNGRDQGGRVSPAGVYLYRLEVGDFLEAKRMTLVK